MLARVAVLLLLFVSPDYSPVISIGLQWEAAHVGGRRSWLATEPGARWCIQDTGKSYRPFEVKSISRPGRQAREVYNRIGPDSGSFRDAVQVVESVRAKEADRAARQRRIAE